jgi:hypothetical protein
MRRRERGDIKFVYDIYQHLREMQIILTIFFYYYYKTACLDGIYSDITRSDPLYKLYFLAIYLGHAVAQAVSHQLSTMAAWVQFQVR